MLSFKIFFKNEIRRFSSNNSTISWDEFQKMLSEIFGTEYHPELNIHYLDQEGDKITLGSQEEWDAALNCLKQPIKLYISEGNQEKYFKDAPPVQVVEAYKLETEKKEPIDNKPVDEDELIHQRFEQKVPKFLHRFFKGKILPNNFDKWLETEGIIKVITLPNGEPDFEINMDQIYVQFTIKGIHLLNSRKYQEGKEFLMDALSMDPKNHTCLYNMACAESLLGNIKQGLDYLNQAIECGYNDVQHLQTDEDVKNLRESPEFNTILAKISSDSMIEEPTIDPSYKYKLELSHLKEMGFTDVQKCIELLEKHNGEVMEVLNRLV